MRKCGIGFFLWMVVGIILGMHIAAGNLEGLWSWWPFFAFLLLAYVDIYIHELGHVLVGMLVKFPIRRVKIGFGREIIRTQVGETSFIVTSGLGGGVTYMGQVSDQWLKFRFLLFVLGGVIAQMVAIGITMVFADISIQAIWSIRSPLSLAKVFIYSNLFLIVANLLPRHFMLFGIKIPNDGLRIAKLPFLSGYEIQEILSAGKIMEAYEAFERKQFNDAEIGFRECIEQYPVPLLSKINLSAALIKQRKFSDAMTLLTSLQDEYEHDPYACLLYNNLAWVHLLLGDNEALQKADAYSLKASTLNPKHPYVIGTRGCTLIEKGDIEAGEQLLLPHVNLKKPFGERVNHPIWFAYLTYAAYRNNSYEKARKYLEKLQGLETPLDPDERLLFERLVERTDNFEKLALRIDMRNYFEHRNKAGKDTKLRGLLPSGTLVLIIVLAFITTITLLYFSSR